MMTTLIRRGRQNEFLWRYGFNIAPSLRYRFARDLKDGDAVADVVSGLRRDGIAVTSAEQLLGKELFSELEGRSRQMLASRSDEIAALKERASDTNAIGQKTFNVELLGSEVTFDGESVLANIALNEKFLDIANAYFEMLVKLRYYNVWYTFATAGSARESQLWHFDREDNYILKVFLYLNDVDEGAGPFTYARGTHRKGGHWGTEPDSFFENNVRRSTDEQMSAMVDRGDWLTATGKKGTIVFADTRGYHKGGEARTSDRLMFTCMYTSPASQSQRLLKFPREISTSGFTRKQICALEIP